MYRGIRSSGQYSRLREILACSNAKHTHTSNLVPSLNLTATCPGVRGHKNTSGNALVSDFVPFVE